MGSLRTMIAALLVFWAGSAIAHQLNVFAYVEEGLVIVEAKFSSGRIPVEGEVRVFDAADTQMMTLDLSDTGTTTFPVEAAMAEGGLRIEVDTGDGHEDYWILTPADIARGAKAGG